MINIFFGSSLLKEEHDKEELELFIRKISKEFKNNIKNFDIRINPLFKNDLNNINQLIEESEYSFFIIFKDITNSEKDELDLAVETFEKNNKPKVYVYFKNIESNIDKSIIELKEKIANEFEHYYNSFNDINEIKLRLIENVFSDKLKNVLIIEENSLKIENIDLSEFIEYKKLPEFANNIELKSLNDEYKKVTKELQTLSNKENKILDLETIYARKTILEEKIKELEQRILNLSINLFELKNQNIKSSTISKAINLFEQGKIDECIDVLELSRAKSLIQDAYKLKSKALKDLEKTKYEVSWAIKETKIIIDLLMLSETKKNKIDLINKLYEDNAKYAIEFEIELDEVFDFINYCISQGYIDKVDLYLNQIKDIIKEKSEKRYPLLYAKLYNLIAKRSSIDNDYEKTIDLYEQTLSYYEYINDKESEEYLNGIILNNYNIAKELSSNSIKDIYFASEKYYNNALLNSDKLLEINFTKYKDLIIKIFLDYKMQSYCKFDERLANIYIKLDNYLSGITEPKNAKEIMSLGDSYNAIGELSYLVAKDNRLTYFNKALEQYNRVKFDSVELNSRKATVHHNIATYYMSSLNYNEAIFNLEKAKSLYKEVLLYNEKYLEKYIEVYGILIQSYLNTTPKMIKPLLDELINNIEILKNKNNKYNELILSCYSGVFYTLYLARLYDEFNLIFYKFEEIYNSINFDNFNKTSRKFIFILFHYFDILLITSDEETKVRKVFDLFIDIYKDLVEQKSINIYTYIYIFPLLTSELTTIEQNIDIWKLKDKLGTNYFYDKFKELIEYNESNKELQDAFKQYNDENQKNIYGKLFQDFDSLINLTDLSNYFNEYDLENLSDDEIDELLLKIKLVLSEINTNLKNKSLYLHMMSHNIHNSIMPIISALEYDLDDESINLIQEYLDIHIKNFDDGLNSLQHNYFTIMRICSLLPVLEISDVDLDTYMQKALIIYDHISQNVEDDSPMLLGINRIIDLTIEELDDELVENYLDNPNIFKLKFIIAFVTGIYNKQNNHDLAAIKTEDYATIYFTYTDELFDYYLEEDNKDDDILVFLYTSFVNTFEYLYSFINEDNYKAVSYSLDSIAEYVSEFNEELADYYSDLSDQIWDEFNKETDE